MIYDQDYPTNGTLKTVISGPPGWRSGPRHCITVLAVPSEILGSSPGSVAASRDLEVHGAMHNWPNVVRVREGLAGRDILVSSCTSDSCGGPGTLTRSPGRFFLCGWLPGWMCVVSRSRLCFGGCMALESIWELQR